MSVTRRGLVALATAAVLALFLPPPVAVTGFAVVMAVVLADAWLVRFVPIVSVDVPPILSRGVAATLSVRVRSTAEVEVWQPATPDLRVEPRRGRGGLQATVRAVRRGAHALEPVATRSRGPLGLGVWYHRAGLASSVVVYPDMPAARRLALEVRLGRFGAGGGRARGPLGLGTDLESIREYQPDDDIRQVNWRATARTGTPMSNTYRVEQDREVMCLLDCGRLMAGPVGDGSERSRLDVAVDAVASLAAVADEVGDRIGVVAFDSGIRRRISSRRGGGDAVVQAVFDLEPTSEDSDYELAFRWVAHSKRAFVLILTDLLEETAATPLVAAMPVLARHHAVTVASVTDPAVVEAITMSSPTVTEALRTVVAVDIERSRRRVTRALSGYGAGVIDSPAGELPARCVGAYLRAKSRARL